MTSSHISTSAANGSGASDTNNQDVYNSVAAILARFNERVETSRNTDHIEDWQEQVPEHLADVELYTRVRCAAAPQYRVVISKAITVPLELHWQDVKDGAATLSTVEVAAAHGFYARDPHIEVSTALWSGTDYNETQTQLTLAEAAQLAHGILAAIDAALASHHPIEAE